MTPMALENLLRWAHGRDAHTLDVFCEFYRKNWGKYENDDGELTTLGVAKIIKDFEAIKNTK
jgi:hypothetical protein